MLTFCNQWLKLRLHTRKGVIVKASDTFQQFIRHGGIPFIWSLLQQR
jgi:hypothetical protein